MSKHSTVRAMHDRIRFINHQGKQILFVDFSNCAAKEVEKIARAAPDHIMVQPRGSVLVLSDFHIDVSYTNGVCATFYYLCSVLDGYSRGMVHWDVRESIKEADIEVTLERVQKKYRKRKPRIISDQGPQFIARA